MQVKAEREREKVVWMGEGNVLEYGNIEGKKRAERTGEAGVEREGGRGGTENEAGRGRAGIMPFDRGGFKMGS